MKKNLVIVVHGGAGKKKSGIISARKGVIRAAQIGYQFLKDGTPALDAVEITVRDLEDNPIFNAGTGSSLNFAGEAEMDASIMDDNLRFGAVAAIRSVRNPISVARKVMEETDHIVLGGRGAVSFARKIGFRPYDPIIRKRKEQWMRLRKEILAGKSHKYFRKLGNLAAKFGTVGAVALDADGQLAAATSSGGIFLRLPGRIGDSAIIGGGTYCDQNGAASATGHGEEIARLILARYAVGLLSKYGAKKAVNLTVDMATKSRCLCGLIMIDRHGLFATGENTGYLAWAAVKNSCLFSF